MDIGGHRFFSKADRVMNWWTELMPVATDGSSSEQTIQYQNRQRNVAISAGATTDADLVMLVRQRKSRIYFLRSFFDYPLALNGKTLGQLGAVADVEDRLELYPDEVLSAQRGEDARRFSDQPLRTGALSHLLQVVYREGVGRALRPDQRRVGRPADQGAVSAHRGCALSAADLWAVGAGRHFAEAHGDVADREVSVSEVWAGAIVGICRQVSYRKRRRGPAGLARGQTARRGRSRRRRLGRGDRMRRESARRSRPIMFFRRCRCAI